MSLDPCNQFEEMTACHSLRIGDTAPDFEGESTQGPIKFHEWAGKSWVLFFSHPADFSSALLTQAPVCTTELAEMARNIHEFSKRGVKVIGISINDMNDHENWVQDICDVSGCNLTYPLIADKHFKIATLYGMVDPASLPTGLPVTVRSVFFVDPSKKVRATISYPASTGRSVPELLRVIDSLQLADKHRVATPVNWIPGHDVIVRADVSNEEAKKIFPDHRTIKPYLRFTGHPQ